jgi:hypothetical protein
MIAAIPMKLPALHSALLDPVFLICLCSAAGNSELVSKFDELVGRNLRVPDLMNDVAMDEALACWPGDFMRFVHFVHAYIYMRLDPKVRADLSAVWVLAGQTSEALSLN